MQKKIIVIGGGPAGYVASIRAAQLGAKVTLIENHKIGGTCLNDGCIPTKALYKSASLYQSISHMEAFGIEIEGATIHVSGIQKHKNGVVETLVSGIESLLKSNKVQVIYGSATFKNAKTLIVATMEGDTIELESEAIIIATGSEPIVPNIAGVELNGVVTSDQLLKFQEIPKRLTIIGGGVIGMEFAGIFNNLGSEVTVVEYADQILLQMDQEIVKRYAVIAQKDGITLHKQTKAVEIEKFEKGLKCTLEGKKGTFDVVSEQILLAVGRKPRIGSLNLDAADIKYTLKGIAINEHFVTNQPGVYAIGDCNGQIMLAHAASHQAIHAVEYIMGQDVQEGNAHVPSCVFVNPEIASVGKTEEQLKEEGILYLKSKFMFGANGKALTMGEGNGVLKVLSDESGKLLGVHIMGPHASDLIHEAGLALHQSLNVEAVKGMIHAHPTLSEAFHEAVLGLMGEAIHMAPIKK